MIQQLDRIVGRLESWQTRVRWRLPTAFKARVNGLKHGLLDVVRALEALHSTPAEVSRTEDEHCWATVE
jgi:hypothetical protein